MDYTIDFQVTDREIEEEKNKSYYRFTDFVNKNIE